MCEAASKGATGLTSSGERSRLNLPAHGMEYGSRERKDIVEQKHPRLQIVPSKDVAFYRLDGVVETLLGLRESHIQCEGATHTCEQT